MPALTTLRIEAGLSKKKVFLFSGMLAIVGSALIVGTEFPAALASYGGASATLAELSARSPGARIGGVALKAKTKRKAPAAVARPAAGLGEATPSELAAPIASAMGAGPVEQLGAAPSSFGALPSEGLDLGLAVDTRLPAPGGNFGFVPPPGGGGVIIGPGGGGGSGGGSFSPPTPEPSPTHTGTPPVALIPTPTVSPIAAVPEPGTWLMLIVGFGFVGATMRSTRRKNRTTSPYA